VCVGAHIVNTHVCGSATRQRESFLFVNLYLVSIKVITLLLSVSALVAVRTGIWSYYKLSLSRPEAMLPETGRCAHRPSVTS
jgi:hypothetical protein